MPDLHPGRGYPVGASFFSHGRFYPALVGSDIGCGVSVWRTDIPAPKVKLDKLDRMVGNLDAPISSDEMARIVSSYPDTEGGMHGVEQALLAAGLDAGFMRSLATIGSGNHFVELQRLEQLAATHDAPPDVINAKHLNLVVHSGSRGLGESILRDHVDRFSHRGLGDESPEALEYLARHSAAVAFAELNRRLIALRILVRLGARAVQEIDVNHNTVTRERFDDIEGWVHRKGATPMAGDLLLIPGSRDHLSYLVRPVSAQAGLSLGSLAHGAGRKWRRADCKARLERKLRPRDLEKGPMGSRIICNDRDLIFEEAGAAYKPIDTVIDSLAGAGLIEVIATFRPVLTYKTRGECC
jgi:release factor H-coupled RctB family protein